MDCLTARPQQELQQKLSWPGLGAKMAAFLRLSLVSGSPTGPAAEKASSRLAMHRRCRFGISHFFRTFCSVKNGCFCACIACALLFQREKASSRPAMHRLCSFGISHFFQLSAVSKMIASVRLSLVARSSIGPAIEQASSRPAPNVQFWHKSFFSNFLRVSIMAGIL